MEADGTLESPDLPQGLVTVEAVEEEGDGSSGEDAGNDEGLGVPEDGVKAGD